MNRVSCPSKQDLQRLLGGRLSPAEVEKLAQHVEACEQCGQTIDGLKVDDTMAGLLRGQANNAGQPLDAAVQKLIGRLGGLRAAVARDGAGPELTKDLYDFLAPAQGPDELGRLGHYRVLKVLGAGGMGVVFLAEDSQLKRKVALKAMMPALAASASAKQRFLREAQATAAIKHDHIVTIYQVGEDRSIPFLAMEFLEGMSLDDFLKKKKTKVDPNAVPGALTLGPIIRLGREIARGLAAAHQRGLIHRDIKPANIWLEAPQGRVKILDFGLARGTGDNSELTQSGAIVGTPAYMSPEQASSNKVDQRTDLFSLGCVLYRLCTGQMPFKGDTPMATLMAVTLETPKSVREINPAVPESLADLVGRLMAKEPAGRPGSAREVIEALQTIEREQAGVLPALASRRKTESPKPAEETPGRESATLVQPARGTRRRWPVIAAGLLLLMGGGLLAQLIIKIKDKDGNVSEFKPAPGATVEIVKDGKVVAQVPGTDNAPPLGGKGIDEAWLKQVQAMPAPEQSKQVSAKMKEVNPGFNGNLRPQIRDGKVVEVRMLTTVVKDLSPLRAFAQLEKLQYRPGGGNSGKTSLADLSPLRGLPLKEVEIPFSQVADLSPLTGMRLRSLDCSYTSVADLAPLQGMPLEHLRCAGTRVADLAPLKGLPLEHLNLNNLKLTNLSPLTGLPLKRYEGPYNLNRDGKIFASMKSLEQINRKPAADVLKGLAAPEVAAGDDDWIKSVQALPVQEQIKQVSAKMKELNPKSDGNLKAKIEREKVVEVSVDATTVKDLAPLRALAGLERLHARTPSNFKGKGILDDLSPLRGLSLKEVSMGNADVADLSPLTGMPIEILRCSGTSVTDLSPLRGMPLKEVNLSRTKVADLSPLAGMPIEILEFGGSLVTDLSPLKGMPLTKLHFHLTAVSDLSPLKDMPLAQMVFWNTRVTDLAPLRGMPLTLLECNSKARDLTPLTGLPLKTYQGPFNLSRDGKIFASMKSLEQINRKPAADVLKGLAAPEPAAVDEDWLKSVQAMTPPEQVKAVTAKMKEHNPEFGGNLKTRIEKGKVISVTLDSITVTDLSPLRAFTGLERFSGHPPSGFQGKGVLEDLSPLRGLPLKEVYIYSVEVADLAPLTGMPIEILDCSMSRVTDLSPLKGMPLTKLVFHNTAVSDLSPLKGMALVELNCGITKVTDFSPLTGMPLKIVSGPFARQRDAAFLLSFKSLEKINGKPVAEFLK